MKRYTVLARSVLVALWLLTATASLLQSPHYAQSTAKQTRATAPVVTIPFELANRHIVLQARIDKSKPLNFILDTGDRDAIVDLDRARELGLKLAGHVRVSGAGTETVAGAFVLESKFSIDGLNGFNQPVRMALPIKRMSSKLGMDFDGIIGHEFIKNFVVEIDYQRRKLHLHDKDKFSYNGKGESIPININGAGHPIVDATVVPVSGEPISGKFVVDIGSGLALALHTPTVTQHKLLGPHLKTIPALGASGAGGRVAGELGRITELRLGSYKFREPIVLFSQDKGGAFANGSLVGNIGSQVMNRFRVFLDYHRDRIILEPNSDLGKSYDRGFTGLSIQAEGTDYRTFRVVDVLARSPASELGLKRDDVISHVNGKPAAELTLTRLNELFEKTVNYELTIQRGAETLKVNLRPRKMV